METNRHLHRSNVAKGQQSGYCALACARDPHNTRTDNFFASDSADITSSVALNGELVVWVYFENQEPTP